MTPDTAGKDARQSAESGAPVQAEPCEHFYAWLSPAGARKSARICQGCGWPDPEWLNHLVEVDRGHGPSCVHCEFADITVTSPGVQPAKTCSMCGVDPCGYDDPDLCSYARITRVTPSASPKGASDD